MTLRERELRMPADTGALGRQLLPADDVYRVIGESLSDVVCDADFAALYEGTGRAAIPPSVLALVTVFQFLEGLPDRQAARAVATRLDWKYALRLPLAAPSFDFTVLHYFRRRLLAGGAERLVFEAVLGRVQALGLLSRRRQRTDATAVLAAVRALSQLETASETVRLAVRALERADRAWARALLPPGFRARYARSVSEYRLPEAARAAALREVGADGSWLLERLATGPTRLRELEAVRTLATVWAQRFESDEAGTVGPRGDGGTDCTERIISPHDPGARAGRKRGKGWVGEQVHVTETAAAGGPNFITDVATEPAAAGDTAALAGIRARLAARGLRPDEQLVDSGYVSGQQLAASAAGGIDLVGPPLADTSPNGFKLADFRLDHQRQVATCPAGVESVKWAERTERDGSRSLQIRFPRAVCAACPLRPRCTTAAGGRNLSLSEHHARLVARRAEAQTAAFKTKLHARAAIEGTLSELVRAHGLRRHRYRGAAQRHLENLLKGTACNLKRLARAVAARPALAAALAGRAA